MKRLFLVIALFLLYSISVFSQQRLLLRINKDGIQEAIPISPDETSNKAILRQEVKKSNSSKHSLFKNPSPQLNYLYQSSSLGIIDTLKHFGDQSTLTSNFGFVHQDVALQWYIPRGTGIVKEFWFRNFTLTGDISKATIRAWNVNNKLLNIPPLPSTKWIGHYKDLTDGDGNVTPFKPISGDQTFYGPSGSDSMYNFDPLTSEATWHPNGVQVTLASNTWQGIKLLDWGDSMKFNYGEPFGFTLMNDSPLGLGDARMEILSYPNTVSTYHSLKFYEAGRTGSTDKGWWLRGDYEWGFYVVIEYTEDRAPNILAVEKLATTISTASRTITATVTDDNPSGGTAGVSSVRLIYRINSGTEDSVSMNNIGGNVFQGALPGSLAGSTVEYSVRAYDVNNLVSQSGSMVYKVFGKTNNALLLYNSVDTFYPASTIAANYMQGINGYDLWDVKVDGVNEVAQALALYNYAVEVTGYSPFANLLNIAGNWLGQATSINKRKYFFSAQEHGNISNFRDTTFSDGDDHAKYFGIKALTGQDYPLGVKKPWEIVPIIPDSVSGFIANYNLINSTRYWSNPSYELFETYQNYMDQVTLTTTAKAIFKDVTYGNKIVGVRNSDPNGNWETVFLAFDYLGTDFISDTTIKPPSNDPKYRRLIDIGNPVKKFFDDVILTPININNSDLEIKQITINSFSPTQINYSYTLKNNGPGIFYGDLISPPVTFQAMLGPDSIFSNAARGAGGFQFTARLNPGEELTFTEPVGLNPQVDYGNLKYLVAKIDNYNVLSELNESNNTIAKKIPIIDVHFKLNTKYIYPAVTANDTIALRGSISPLTWTQNSRMIVSEGDSIYSINVSIPRNKLNDTLQYKFYVGRQNGSYTWEDSVGVGSPTYYNRTLVLSDTVIILPIVYFNNINRLLVPHISVNPDSVVATLDEGDTTTQYLTITNTGEGTLSWDIKTDDLTILSQSIHPNNRFLENIVLQKNQGANRKTSLSDNASFLQYHEQLKQFSQSSIIKGMADTRVGPQVITTTGGPDSGGYRWIDSDSPGGPIFNWQDIKGVGTQIQMVGDDANVGSYPIGFNFNFYNNDYTQFRICTNGWISFTNSGNPWTNLSLPSISAPENIIAAFWDDLYFSSNKSYYYNDGQKLIIQYDNVQLLDDAFSSLTFQILLYPNGDVVLQYNTMIGNVLSATIGIQNSSKSVGLTVVFNASYIHNNLAVKFNKQIQSFISVIPLSGSLASSVSQQVAVKLNSAGKTGGSSNRSIINLIHNDPIKDTIHVPVRMDINTDGIAPSTIVNLIVSQVAATSIQLNWTAPGDNGNSGTAIKYDLRYSTFPINESNFASATRDTTIANPVIAGAIQIHTVRNLFTNTQYYFAIKTLDEVSNTSAISNVVTSTPINSIKVSVNLITFVYSNNGDGILNPGEFFRIQHRVKNNTSQNITGLRSVIDWSYDPMIYPYKYNQIFYFDRNYGNVNIGDSTGLVYSPTLVLSAQAPNGYIVTLPFKFYDVNNILLATDTLRLLVSGSDQAIPYLFSMGTNVKYVPVGSPITINANVNEGGPITSITDSIWNIDTQTLAGVVMLHDDGTNGDPIPGDHFFYGQFTPTVQADYGRYLRVVDSLGNTFVTDQRQLTLFTSKLFVVTTNQTLIIDGESSIPQLTKQYTKTMDRLGKSYNVWRTYLNGSIDTSFLNKYQHVIYFHNYPSTQINSITLNNLMLYLNRGGRLFITGPAIAEIHNGSTFANNYLHTTLRNSYGGYDVANGITGDPLSGNLPLTLVGGDGYNTNSIYYSDEVYKKNINDTSQVDSIFINPYSGGITGLRVEKYPYRLVYLGFPFEAISDSTKRDTLMGRILGWLDVPVKQIVPLSIPLAQNWNLISWNVDTKNDSTQQLLSALIANTKVILGYKNGGLTFDPTLPANINTLTTMDHLHGYWFKMLSGRTFALSGEIVQPGTILPLSAGYNTISYLPAQNDSVTHALQSVLDNTDVILGFENGGLTYDPTIPARFNSLKILKPTSGYWVKLRNADTLIYPGSVIAPPQSHNIFTTKITNEEKKDGVVPTREWINLWGANITLDGKLLPIGMVVQAISKNGVLCGKYIIENEGEFGMMSIYRDDPSTEAVEGVNPGDEVSIRLGDFTVPKTITWKSFGEIIDFAAIITSIGGELQSTPKEFALSQNYPNPFNPITTIQFAVPKESHVMVTIYDLLGKEITVLVNGELKAGYYRLQWDGKDNKGTSVASGVYFYRMVSDKYISTKKMLLMK